MPEVRDRASLTAQLAQLIADTGPITVARYMAEANAYYYATRDPLGATGDFITAPEISQMFGELIGVWLAEVWHRSGQPEGCRYVELGPGRGTLADDALRAMRSAGLDPTIELVETSPVLRGLQSERLPQARWHDDVQSLPRTGPLLIVANEFFDALPVDQYVSTDAGWRERLVGWGEEGFFPVAGGPVSEPPGSAPPGGIVERSPASIAILQALAERIARQGGLVLVIDYGSARTAMGDTLQAVRSHRHADPWIEPGEADLTAHVDFEALASAAEGFDVSRHGPVGQGVWLRAIGIDLRSDALARKFPNRASEIASARDRLVNDDAMGRLFKVMALIASSWARPAGFA